MQLGTFGLDRSSWIWPLPFVFFTLLPNVISVDTDLATSAIDRPESR
jgi:hypothetical protein